MYPTSGIYAAILKSCGIYQDTDKLEKYFQKFGGDTASLSVRTAYISALMRCKQLEKAARYTKKLIGNDQVTLGTLHAFCKDFKKEFPKHPMRARYEYIVEYTPENVFKSGFATKMQSDMFHGLLNTLIGV